MFQFYSNKNLLYRLGRPALLWKMILFCLYFEVCRLTMLWAPVRYLMVSIEIVSIEWEGGWAIRWCDNITKYVVQTQPVCIISNIFYTTGISWPGLTKLSDSRAPPPPPTIWCPWCGDSAAILSGPAASGSGQSEPGGGMSRPLGWPELK